MSLTSKLGKGIGVGIGVEVGVGVDVGVGVGVAVAEGNSVTIILSYQTSAGHTAPGLTLNPILPPDILGPVSSIESNRS